MLVFDNKFSAKVEEIDEVNIQMQMRYVDDTNLAVNVMIEDDFYEEEMLENTSCLSQYLVNFDFSNIFSLTLDNKNYHEDTNYRY